MTTTPAEPTPDPEIVPSGDPSISPEPSGPDTIIPEDPDAPQTQPSPLP